MSRHERLTRLAITLAATALVAVACTTQPRTSTATEQPQATAAARPATTAAAAAPTPTFQPQEVTGPNQMRFVSLLSRIRVRMSRRTPRHRASL